MWNDKDRDAGRNGGTYRLRDVLAQVTRAEGRADAPGKAPTAAGPLVPPPIPERATKKARVRLEEEPAPSDGPQRDVPILPPKGISYAATGALVSVAALVLAHALAPSKPRDVPVKITAPAPVSPAPVPAREIGSGPLVSTLASLSKTVLAGFSRLPPPDELTGGEANPRSNGLALSEVIRLRASNVVTGFGGPEASWPIEILTPGIGLPNAKILIEGLPAAAKLNHGWLRTDGRWMLSPADLPGLTVTVPAAFARAAVTVSLVNENDTAIAHADAIVEPVPQPEAAAAPMRSEVSLQERFNAFLEKWKLYQGRTRLTEAERAALFVEYRAIVESADAKPR